MSCGRCNRWQHIPCHDSADARAGRPKRNWDVVDFTCQKCLDKRNGSGSKKKLLHVHPQPSPARHHPSLPQPHGRYNQASNGYEQYSEEPPFVPAYSKRDIPRQSTTGVTFAHYQPLQQGFRAESLPRLMLSPQGTAQASAAPQHSHTNAQAYPPYTNGHSSLGMNGYGSAQSSSHTPSTSIRTQFESSSQYGGQPIHLPPPRVDLSRPAPSTSAWIPYSSPGAAPPPPLQGTQFRDGYPASLYTHSTSAPGVQYHQHQSQQPQGYHNYPNSYSPTVAPHHPDTRVNPPTQYTGTANHPAQHQYNNPQAYHLAYPPSSPVGRPPSHPQASAHAQVQPRQPDTRG